ncbi:3-phosphoshikimate 1-carboxyvinyltransferase 1 [bacterium HR29]|nr:3-phosphoshikimate 1-carboxyvinyltransferase 1 [bacterium HR29]
MTTISRPPRIRARLRVPSDKSISHRALLFGALADGASVVERPLDSADVRSTARCLAALGAEIVWPPGSERASIRGRGLHGLSEPEDVLDCGNSGTTMRLLAGILAGQPLLAVLTGDASLRRRPMDRIVRPLQEMGATVFARMGNSRPPLVVRGGNLHPISYRSPVASAQVKSAVALAALFADGTTRYEEPSPSRDHTERMLAAMGASIRTEGKAIVIEPADRLTPLTIRVPGDISSAAPWLVLAVCHPDAEVLIEDVNLNPTRTGIIDILRAMGGEVAVLDLRHEGGEPVGALAARSSQLRGAEVAGALVPRAIDELPLVALAACFAQGRTVVRDAAELRVKESDRIAMVGAILGRFGVRVELFPDGFAVEGPQPLRGARIDAGGDHRMGMLAGVAGALADGETRVLNDAVEVSYPAFWRDLSAIAAGEGVPG